MAADRDLLFGLLALQNGLIDQVQLVAAFQSWTRDRARSLADHLVARGDLDAADRAALDALEARHLRKNDSDPAKSIASIIAGRPPREQVALLNDPDLNATIAGSDSRSADPGAGRGATISIGSSSADGQRFRILRPHAQGGLGAVFVALDSELNREVALKRILDRHADDPVSRQRFLLEAEVTGGLEHPGIVPVYGLGTHADGCPFYAMRFIRGENLQRTIDRFHADGTIGCGIGRWSLELRKLLRSFLDVCYAIEYAHSRGVLHRDVKPSNVVVGNHGETLVIDWGLAKARGPGEGFAPPEEERPLTPSSSGGSPETLPGSALGTLAYMSPEQARGELDALGPRSDVYSLGATLYCLLTGRPPFDGDDPGAVLQAVQRGAFPPPRRHDPDIGRPLEAICLKAMAPRPEDRYGSARDLADDVDRWLADEPVSAYSEGALKKASRWLRHHPGMRAWGIALIVAEVALLMAWAGLFPLTLVFNESILDRHGSAPQIYDADDHILYVISMRIQFFYRLTTSFISWQAGALLGAAAGLVVPIRRARYWWVILCTALGSILGLGFGAAIATEVMRLLSL